MSVRQENLPQSNVWLISVSGRLDQTLIPKLEETFNDLLANERYHLIVDLTETTYINSGGLRCLVSAWRQTKTNNGSLILCGLNSRLQEIFSMVGFDKLFEIHADCAAARKAANPKTKA